ncbi:hypothetical protein HYC85_011923 [Camellia sinensis]|uniref:Solute-binding protein family 3/N-terminal domain-containing protein n=1 Tax=Camellia sinensis TaxID=4442 RepID=A0A7J7HAH2_CAMSI|nr:hypothetical protein HYC85_011923 [Camellia sinensis]
MRAVLFIDVIVAVGFELNSISPVVFPKGSPLVADVSRAVINITEGHKILDTEQQWFGNTTCSKRNSFTSNSLTLQSFVGLFSITGCVIVLFLIVYIVKYIYGNIDLHKRIWDSSTTTWFRFCALCMHFDQRDLSSYPFSKKIKNWNLMTLVDRFILVTRQAYQEILTPMKWYHQ